MSPWEQDLFRSVLEKEVQAWRMLHDPEVMGKLTGQQVEELSLAAGYGKKAAEKAGLDRRWERMKAGLDEL